MGRGGERLGEVNERETVVGTERNGIDEGIIKVKKNDS